MKVEILDRDLWLRQVNVAINRIKTRRLEEDAAYELKWAERYDRRGWLRYLIGPLERAPNPMSSKIISYPSYYAWRDLELLENIRRALQTRGTGPIYLTGDEIRAIL